MATYYDRKDYSRPLHVDCSVEYELPNAAKPPANAGSEPLLMIHPCYYRRAESQRRSPFINNLPATTRVPQYTVRYSKRDPMLCGTSSGDSGVSGLGHWPDPASPEARLQGPDSGIVEDKSGLTTAVTGPCWQPTTEPSAARLYGTSRSHADTTNRELRDSTNQINQVPRQHGWSVPSSELLGEVNNNIQLPDPSKDVSIQQQPAVGVAAVAACKVCQLQILHTQQRPQQPWPGLGVTAPAVACAPAPSSRQRVCAVEPGPDHAAYPQNRRTLPARPAPPAKRSRLLIPPSDWCKVCTQWNYPQCRGTQDNSRVPWNNESMLRLYQV